MTILQELQTAAGATFTDGIPTTYGNDDAARTAAATGVALCDRSHWGYLEVSDSDRIRFLHNQTTNDFMTLQPGQGCQTVFVTSTARTVDLVSAYVLEDAVRLLCSPTCRESLLAWMDRFIFFSDKVQLKDITELTATLSLIGPQSHELLQSLGLDMVEQPPQSHRIVKLGGIEVRVAAGSGLASPGYTLFTDIDAAPELWRLLTDRGALPLGDRLWEELRIMQGRPVPEQELTEDYNPLEAGLWQAVSFNKGCYIGQETIARLHTYGGPKQLLWSLELSGPVATGERITVDGERAGVVTSVVQTPQGWRGLGYIRSKMGGAGLNFRSGEIAGTVVEAPFLTRQAES
ncbi:MAG: folate-binding protein [Cyanobacteria bacterium P01_A01_bin.135]